MKDLTVKVCFVLDCTASMGPWIEAAKHRILDLLKDLSTQYPNFKIFVAFMGYRDFEEEWHSMSFTSDHNAIHDLVKNLSPLGGGDAAEDVAGAYRWVSNLNWNADVRAVFHITDAPAHGTKFHDQRVSDDYPDGNPTDDLCQLVRQLAKEEVDLTVFRLNHTTDIMYEYMKYEYKDIHPDGFRIVDFMSSGDSEENAFYEQVSSQLMYSMDCTQSDPTN
jgi:Mg-chelatase subunit ChlD